MSVVLVSISPHLRKGRNFPKERVRVFNGSMTKSLGEGTLINYVTTYYFWSHDLKTFHLPANQEKRPSHSSERYWNKKGYVLRINRNDPKIRLDTGDIIYGTQCWWDVITELK